jgi:hypothetical protein
MNAFSKKRVPINQFYPVSIHMNLNSIVAIAWVTRMMVSPESLVLQGNIVGTNGLTFFVVILSAIALHGFNAKIYQLIPTNTNPQSGAIFVLKDTFGSLTASMLLLLSRLVLAIC